MNQAIEKCARGGWVRRLRHLVTVSPGHLVLLLAGCVGPFGPTATVPPELTSAPVPTAPKNQLVQSAIAMAQSFDQNDNDEAAIAQYEQVQQLDPDNREL